MSYKPYAIFAPHVDDEMIGCWRLLQHRLVSKVYYFFELTEERKQEALRVGRDFEFEPIFTDTEDWQYDLVSVPADLTIVAPHIKDEHPHHKYVNRLAKSLPNEVAYYSVDMNVPKEVIEEPLYKRTDLLLYYPSQHKLIEKDDKYHLFESLLADDSTKKIWVKFQREGIHCYPAAATDPKLADVSFLASPHRHMFHFRVDIEVFHDDRDIEFIQFKRWLESLYKEGTLQLDFMSCEMLSEALYKVISAKYPGRAVTIEVSEDGENGSVISWEGSIV